VVEPVLMSEIALPLLAVDGDDIRLCESFRDAEKMIEPIDVERGDVLFLDARGTRLTVEVSTDRRYSFAVDPEHPEGPAMLEAALRAYFAGLPPRRERLKTSAAEALNLSALVALFLQLERGEEPQV
jgi:hypothetical protein